MTLVRFIRRHPPPLIHSFIGIFFFFTQRTSTKVNKQDKKKNRKISRFINLPLEIEGSVHFLALSRSNRREIDVTGTK